MPPATEIGRRMRRDVAIVEAEHVETRQSDQKGSAPAASTARSGFFAPNAACKQMAERPTVVLPELVLGADVFAVDSSGSRGRTPSTGIATPTTMGMPKRRRALAAAAASASSMPSATTAGTSCRQPGKMSPPTSPRYATSRTSTTAAESCVRNADSETRHDECERQSQSGQERPVAVAQVVEPAEQTVLS